MTVEEVDELVSLVCDQLCHHPFVMTQEELDEKCESCPLAARMMEAVEGTAIVDPVTAAGVCRCRDCQLSYESKSSSTGWKCIGWGVFDIDCECDPDGFCHKGKRRTDNEQS